MEKHCDNCIYRSFEENDRFKTYGFCSNKNTKAAHYVINTKNRLAVMKEISVPSNCIPACICVQTYYDGKCPYKKEGLN